MAQRPSRNRVSEAPAEPVWPQTLGWGGSVRASSSDTPAFLVRRLLNLVSRDEREGISCGSGPWEGKSWGEPPRLPGTSRARLLGQSGWLNPGKRDKRGRLSSETG